MDVKDKLTILADAAKYDASCASSGVKRKATPGGIGNAQGSGICHSYTPDGRCISLLKILLTNFCIYDCSYCINRVSSQVKRAKFTVDEIVALTMDFYKRNYIEGLFLSSGVAKNADDTMDEMVLVAKKLRVEHKFGGYIHLKAVAGCSPALLRKAGLYADRLSANIELPTQDDLNHLAPAKTHAEIEDSMNEIREGIQENRDDRAKFSRAPSFAPGGQSTQMIVGATATSDRTIMLKADQLYQQQNLKRVYYSAFSPIPDSDPNLPPQAPPLMREHRLYQTDWLIRLYGFGIDEILPQEKESLDLDKDPKLAWALRNRHLFPVDINTAPKEMLLRVPGIGAQTVQRILSSRRYRKVRMADLAKTPSMQKAKYFILTGEDTQSARLIDSPHLEGLLLERPQTQLDMFSSLTGIV